LYLDPARRRRPRPVLPWQISIVPEPRGGMLNRRHLGPLRGRRAGRRARVGALVLFVCLLLAPVQGASAQGCAAPMPCRPDPPPAPSNTEGHLVSLGINAALGGLTAGVRQQARGGSFWRGFALGAAGGGAVYAGKWLSVEPHWGAGLAGRQVAALGASVIRNASEDRPALESLLVPIGPVRLHVERGANAGAHLKLDLVGAAVSTYFSLSSGSRFDAGASLSAGTPVFQTLDAWYPGWRGNNTAGVIVLLDEAVAEGSIPPEQVFAHERVHLLQYDQAMHTWSAPFEQWLLRRVPGGERISRHVDIGLFMVPAVILNQVIPYHSRPWEREAFILSGS
jgi:hypothetical protein